MNFLKIGQLVKPHGVKGEIKVFPLTDNINRYKKLSTVFLLINNQYIKEEIISVKNTPKFVIIKFKNYNKKEDVEKLRNIYLFINREEGEPLGEGEYYTQDLIGCSFWYKNENLGTVINIINEGSCYIFVVKDINKEILFPFLNEYIEDIDIKNKKIIVNQFEGFF